MPPKIFAPNIFCCKFPSCASATMKFANTKRVSLKGARFLDVFFRRTMIADPLFSWLPSCAFSAHYCRDTVPSECGLTVFLRRRSKCNGQLPPEREARPPSPFLPRSVWFQRQKTRAKRKASRVLSQPVLEYQGSRLVFQQTAVLRPVPARARKLHDSRNKVLVEFLRNGHK